MGRVWPGQGGVTADPHCPLWPPPFLVPDRKLPLGPAGNLSDALVLSHHWQCTEVGQGPRNLWRHHHPPPPPPV